MFTGDERPPSVTEVQAEDEVTEVLMFYENRTEGA